MNVINAQKTFTKCELFSIIWQFRLDHPLNQTYIKVQTSFGSLKKDWFRSYLESYQLKPMNNNNSRKDADKSINKAVQETKDKMKESWQNFDADQAKKDMEGAFDPKDTTWTCGRISIVVVTGILVAALAIGLFRLFL